MIDHLSQILPCTASELDAALTAELITWLGTPHFDRIAKREVGIDCINLVRVAFVAVGWLPDFELPYYSPNWGLDARNNVMERLLLKCCNAEIVTGAPQPGDLLIFKVGKQANHIAIFAGGKVWHSITRAGVRCDEWEVVKSRLQCIIRLTSPGFRVRPETLTSTDFLK
jgi:cell wall-associated NlpC family hydrolase